MQNLKIRRIVVGQLQTNCYLVIDKKSRQALIIDPGDDADYITRVVNDEKAEPIKIIATHGHFDHILAVGELSLAYQIPFLLHQKDEFLVQRMRQTTDYFLDVDPGPSSLIGGYLQQGDKVELGEVEFKVIETPGHTPGSVSLYCEEEKVVVVGDLIFAGGGVGRTDFSYSNFSDLQNSIQKILKLPEETVVLSGHSEETSIEQERRFFSGPINK